MSTNRDFSFFKRQIFARWENDEIVHYTPEVYTALAPELGADQPQQENCFGKIPHTHIAEIHTPFRDAAHL